MCQNASLIKMHVCIGLGADLGKLSIGIFLVFLVDMDLSVSRRYEAGQ